LSSDSVVSELLLDSVDVSDRLWLAACETEGIRGGTVSPCGCWEGEEWLLKLPRERMRPKDAKRECARVLVDDAVFDWESRMVAVGRPPALLVLVVVDDIGGVLITHGRRQLDYVRHMRWARGVAWVEGGAGMLCL